MLRLGCIGLRSHKLYSNSCSTYYAGNLGCIIRIYIEKIAEQATTLECHLGQVLSHQECLLILRKLSYVGTHLCVAED